MCSRSCAMGPSVAFGRKCCRTWVTLARSGRGSSNAGKPLAPGSKLTPLQERILAALGGLTPPWTLTGGGALAGVHTGHRGTRDLDLFWRERLSLDDTPRDVAATLQRAGLRSEILRTSRAFAELRVQDGPDVCIVDLVAESASALQTPISVIIAGVTIQVDTSQAILAADAGLGAARVEPRTASQVDGVDERIGRRPFVVSRSTRGSSDSHHPAGVAIGRPFHSAAPRIPGLAQAYCPRRFSASPTRRRRYPEPDPGAISCRRSARTRPAIRS